MNLKKRILVCAMTLLTVFASVITCSAKEDKDVEYQGVYFKADYSDNITPMKGDTFTITYSVVNMDNSPQAEITIDAYDIAETPQKLEFPKGYTYQIDMIQYTGENGGIFSYTVDSVFNVYPEGEEKTETIYIGIEKAQAAYKKFNKPRSVGIITEQQIMGDGGPDSVRTYEDIEAEYKQREDERMTLSEAEDLSNKNSTTEHVAENSKKQDDVYTDGYDENYGVEVQNPSGDEPSVEVYTTESTTEDEKKTTKDESGSSNKLVLIIVVIIIAAAALVITSRKGRGRR